jgi:hypothetical protein
MKNVLSMILLVVIISSVGIVNGQGKYGTVGKIFSKKEANVLFGKVIGSVQIKADDLNQALSQADAYVLFTIKNSQAVVTNEKRKPLLTNLFSAALTADEPMFYFSKSVLQDFLQKIGNSSDMATVSSSNATTASANLITVEVRSGVTTLSSGAYTLELSCICPPYCP